MSEQRLAWATSADGTQVAYWTSGTGRPLVLVHGAGSLHTTWSALLPYLEPHITVHAMDRRGHGASADGEPYDVLREYEDIAAVVDAAAEASGTQVDLLGHSFGGMCVLGAIQHTTSIRCLVLYEGWPPANPEASTVPDGLTERLDALLADGSRDVVLKLFYREVAGMAEAELGALREIPGWWEARLAIAHTVPRELRAEHPWVSDPGGWAAITLPTLLLVGSDSPDDVKAGYETVAAALPNARVALLHGQQHLAHVTAPELLAAEVLPFLKDA